MSRRLLAVLIAGAIAATGTLAWSGWPPHSDYLPILICYEVIGLSFLAAGIAAWVRWPASRLGLLFTIVGYLYLVPYILVNLANPVAFTIGNLSQGIYTAAAGPPGLAWPTGRLRSRFECGVVIAEYVTEHRLQRGRDDVLESRLQRLQRQLPGQRAARRRRFPADLERHQHDQAGPSGWCSPASC